MDIKTKRRLEMAMRYIISALGLIFAIYPVIWIISSALNPHNVLSTRSLIPPEVSLDNFRDLFAHQSYPFFRWYWNSIKLATATSVLTVLLTATTGYAFSKFKFWGRKYGLILMLIVQMFPVFMAMVAIYAFLSMFGLTNTHRGILIFYLGGAVPFSSWLLKGYFDTVPDSLRDAAVIDGANRFQIFWKIMLPLAKPMLAVVAMKTFVGPFNDFVLARILLSSRRQYTLALGLYNMVTDQFSQAWTMFSAGALLSAIPVMILFLSMQKYFVGGLAAGATKG